MLRIIEISTAEHLATERAKEVASADYLYILKHNNTFMLVDNGVAHYMNSIITCTGDEYDAITTPDQNILYLVNRATGGVNNYMVYFKGELISSKDSNTVNGHTVESDVPAGAVFTDTIYDDSAILAAIEELQTLMPVVEDLQADSHTHTNKTVLDKISESTVCNHLYNGQ